MACWLISLIGISLVAYVFPHQGSFALKNGTVTDGTEGIKDSRICSTSICQVAADRIISSMNKSVDRCFDFYEYACGNWLSNHPTPNYIIESKWNEDTHFLTTIQLLLRDELEAEPSAEDILPIQQLKKIYKSCMDNETRVSEGLEPMMKRIRETNGWPMIMNNGTWNKDAMTWQKIVHCYENLFETNPFYSLSTAFIQLGYHGLTISLPALGMITYRNNRTEYLSVMNNVIPLFVKESETKISDEELKKDIDNMIKFENALFEAAQRKQVDTKYFTNISSFTEWWNDYVPSSVPHAKIDWETTLQRLLNIRNLPMTKHTAFRLQNVDFFKELVKILESTDERTIVNFIQWFFVLKLLEYSSVADKMLPPRQITDRYQDIRPRWIDCIEALKTDPVTFHLFGRKYFPNHTKATLKAMMKIFENSLGLEAINSSWLSFEEKEEVKKRVISTTEYPEWYDNETAIIDYYKDLKISNSYFENFLSLHKIRWLNEIRRWGKFERTESGNSSTYDFGQFDYDIFSKSIKFIKTAH